MNDFPRMLYKFPGAEEIHGARFATLIVQDADEQDEALADGWSITTDEARAPKAAPAPAPSATQDADEQDATPDRDALKAEATALGLEFPKNVPTERLVEMIAEAKAGA